MTTIRESGQGRADAAVVDLRRGGVDVDGRRQCGVRAERVVGHHRRHGQGRVERRPARRDGHA